MHRVIIPVPPTALSWWFPARNSSRRPPLRKKPTYLRASPSRPPSFLFFISTRRGINKHCVCAPLGYIMEYYVSEIPLFLFPTLPPPLTIAPKRGVCTRYLLQIPMVPRIVFWNGDNTSHCTWEGESTVYKNCGEVLASAIIDSRAVT